MNKYIIIYRGDILIKENSVYCFDAIDFMRMAYEELGDQSVQMFLEVIKWNYNNI